MGNISKKEIRQSLRVALVQVLSNLEVSVPSQKSIRLIEKVSKRVSNKLKRELKEKYKKGLNPAAL